MKNLQCLKTTLNKIILVFSHVLLMDLNALEIDNVVISNYFQIITQLINNIKDKLIKVPILYILLKVVGQTQEGRGHLAVYYTSFQSFSRMLSCSLA